VRDVQYVGNKCSQGLGSAVCTLMIPFLLCLSPPQI
jgi:hypothetical protein